MFSSYQNSINQIKKNQKKNFFIKATAINYRLMTIQIFKKKIKSFTNLENNKTIL